VSLQSRRHRAAFLLLRIGLGNEGFVHIREVAVGVYRKATFAPDIQEIREIVPQESDWIEEDWRLLSF
jgi:hypothetical protein